MSSDLPPVLNPKSRFSSRYGSERYNIRSKHSASTDAGDNVGGISRNRSLIHRKKDVAKKTQSTTQTTLEDGTIITETKVLETRPDGSCTETITNVTTSTVVRTNRRGQKVEEKTNVETVSTKEIFIVEDDGEFPSEDDFRDEEGHCGE